MIFINTRQHPFSHRVNSVDNLRLFCLKNHHFKSVEGMFFVGKILQLSDLEVTQKNFFSNSKILTPIELMYLLVFLSVISKSIRSQVRRCLSIKIINSK